jgi:hypothetical protein
VSRSRLGQAIAGGQGKKAQSKQWRALPAKNASNAAPVLMIGVFFHDIAPQLLGRNTRWLSHLL